MSVRERFFGINAPRRRGRGGGAGVEGRRWRVSCGRRGRVSCGRGWGLGDGRPRGSPYGWRAAGAASMGIAVGARPLISIFSRGRRGKTATPRASDAPAARALSQSPPEGEGTAPAGRGRRRGGRFVNRPYGGGGIERARGGMGVGGWRGGGLISIFSRGEKRFRRGPPRPAPALSQSLPEGERQDGGSLPQGEREDSLVSSPPGPRRCGGGSLPSSPRLAPRSRRGRGGAGAPRPG